MQDSSYSIHIQKILDKVIKEIDRSKSAITITDIISNSINIVDIITGFIKILINKGLNKETRIFFITDQIIIERLLRFARINHGNEPLVSDKITSSDNFIIDKVMQWLQSGNVDINNALNMLSNHIRFLMEGKVGILIVTSHRTLNNDEIEFIEKLVNRIIEKIKDNIHIIFISPADNSLHNVVSKIHNHNIHYQKLSI